MLFEAPTRLGALLQDLARVGGAGAPGCRRPRADQDARGDFAHGTLAELADYYSEHEPRGEITVVVAGTGAPAPEEDRTEEAAEHAVELLAEGLSRREVARRLTESHGLSRNDAYRLVTGLP